MTGGADELLDELDEARERLAALEAGDGDPEAVAAARDWVEFLEGEIDLLDPGPYETCLAEYAERASAETAERRAQGGPLATVRKLL